MTDKAWVGFDLDGTIAEFNSGVGISKIGKPIPSMIEYIQTYLAMGFKVKIVTARAALPDQIPMIKAWCKEHIGEELEVTDRKDFDMYRLYDDRAVTVKFNRGFILTVPFRL